MDMKLKTYRKEVQVRMLFRKVAKELNIEKVIKKFGEKDVKWVLNKYLTGSREKARMLKQKKQAELEIARINKKLGM